MYITILKMFSYLLNDMTGLLYKDKRVVSIWKKLVFTPRVSALLVTFRLGPASFFIYFWIKMNYY